MGTRVRSMILVGAAMAALLAPAVADARTNTRNKPIVFVHGFERGADNNCPGTWNTLMFVHRLAGWSNTFYPVQYYNNDRVCPNPGALPNGRPNVQNIRIANGTTDTSIRTLARLWAWEIHNRFSRNSIAVDVVAHSMGGLIVRYAISRTGRNPDFPPFLVVEDVVTLGTPHSGTNWARACALTHDQCDAMTPGSSFLNDLSAHQNPQGAFGTQWTAVGASDDDTVTAGSATSMRAAHEVIYWAGQGIEHGQYMHKVSGNGCGGNPNAASARFNHGGAWTEAPCFFQWPVQFTDTALFGGNW